MNVDGFGGVTFDGFEDRGSEGQVGDEVSVHDVEVEFVDASFFSGADGVGQVAEIGGE